MPYYKRLTVKIELLDENSLCKSIGSGIICVYKSCFYVLTAYHCINPKDQSGKVYPRPQNWSLHLSDENGNDFVCKRIVDEINYKDIAVLEIENPNGRFSDGVVIAEDRVQLFTDTAKSEKYLFRGFPDFCQYQPHTFELTCGDDNWWRFVQSDISAGRVTGVDILKGASGSGIFFVRRNKCFIVAVALHLHDTKGTMNEVYAVPVSEYRDLLPADAFKTFSADMLADWEAGMNEENTARQIEELKKDRIEWIDNLVRKLKVMFPEQYLEKLDLFLGYYVKGRDFFIKQGESNSSFREALSKTTDAFFEDNQPDPKIYVDTSGEAVKEFKQLSNDLVKEMSSLIPEDSGGNKVGNSYARYRLTERLLVCTLEYLKRGN